MPSVLTSPRCPDADDPDVARLLELAAGLTGASSVQLELQPDGGRPRCYGREVRTKRFSEISLDLGRYSATLHNSQ